MRSLFAYSLLAAQLVLVHFVAALLPPLRTYAVGSVKTNFWIADYSVAAGNDVQTAYGQNGAPDDAAFFSINPGPGSAQVVSTTIYSRKYELYVGLDEPVTPGSRLKWVSTEYNWQIAYFGTDNSSFVIYPPGQDYYWFDNFSIPAVVEVDHGRNIMDGDFFWMFQTAF